MNELEALARAAGLARAWSVDPAAVEQAVARAARMRSELRPPEDPTAEPTPAFRAPGLCAGGER